MKEAIACWVDKLLQVETARFALGPALALLLVAGCAARPAESWSSGTHRVCSGRECYGFGQLDATWRVVEHKKAEIGFFNASLGGVIQSNATCRDDGEAAGLESLTDQLLIGYTERRVRTTELIPLAAREALRTIVDVKLDGVPLVLDLYVLKRNGCVFDFSFVVPPGRYEQGVANFKQFVAGFTPGSQIGSR